MMGTMSPRFQDFGCYSGPQVHAVEAVSHGGWPVSMGVEGVRHIPRRETVITRITPLKEIDGHLYRRCSIKLMSPCPEAVEQIGKNPRPLQDNS